MLHTLPNKRTVTIPDREIDNYMKSLKISKDEAIELWLDDNDYVVNEERKILDDKAKKANVKLGLHATDEKKERKPRTIHTSDEKQLLFNELQAFLTNFCAEDGRKVEILTQNKLFSVKINDKSFKIDIIQSRK